MNAKSSVPPLTHLPRNAGSRRELFINSDFTFRHFVEEPPRTEFQINAAAPATCGVAIDVPFLFPYRPPGIVLKIRTPGAAMSTSRTPKLLNRANELSSAIAAIVRMLLLL